MDAPGLESIARAFGSPSYGRASQAPAMRAWKGQPALVTAGQRALRHRARCNSAARDARYTSELEPERA
jgi:fructose-bisphosphate aldolase class I